MSSTALPVTVVPSLPAASLEELLALGTALAGSAAEFQVDLVDGAFVAARSWPFTEAGEPAAALTALAPLAAAFALEMDCMVHEPVYLFEAFAALGVARVTLHYGSAADLDETIARARGYGFSVGLAAINDVPLPVLEAYLPRVDYLQLMGIATVGEQGQPFDPRTLPRAAALRAAHSALTIAVDGSVNADTLPMLRAAGVNRFAPGSAVARAADPRAAYAALAALAGSQQP